MRRIKGFLLRRFPRSPQNERDEERDELMTWVGMLSFWSGTAIVYAVTPLLVVADILFGIAPWAVYLWLLGLALVFAPIIPLLCERGDENEYLHTSIGGA